MLKRLLLIVCLSALAACSGGDPVDMDEASSPDTETSSPSSGDGEESSGDGENGEETDTAPLGLSSQPVRLEPENRALRLAGNYQAVSNTAMSITGDARFEADVISLANGQTITTRLHRILPADEAYSDQGKSWAALLFTPENGKIQLREVVAVALNGDGQPLCGQRDIHWAALGMKEAGKDGQNNVMSVSLALISSPEEPGPSAEDVTVCAQYNYAG